MHIDLRPVLRHQSGSFGVISGATMRRLSSKLRQIILLYSIHGLSLTAKEICRNFFLGELMKFNTQKDLLWGLYFFNPRFEKNTA